MTHLHPLDKRCRMGRPALSKKDLTVKTTLRFPQGLLDRIAAAAGENKTAAYIREAVEEKLARDEQRPAPKPEADA